MNPYAKSDFKGATKNLSELHDKYFVVPADKATNKIVFVYKTHNIDCLIKGLGVGISSGREKKKNTETRKVYFINSLPPRN